MKRKSSKKTIFFLTVAFKVITRQKESLTNPLTLSILFLTFAFQFKQI